MASITTILGTDSLASSRIVLNDNFAAINDEIEDVTGLLDVAAQTLTLTGGLNGGSLSIASGSNLLSVDVQTGVTASVPVTAESRFTMQGDVIASFETAVTSLPLANDYQSSVYFIDGSQLSSGTVAAGDDGQLVTFIATNGAVTLTGDFAGGSQAVIQENGSISLVFQGTLWYATASHDAAIS